MSAGSAGAGSAAIAARVYAVWVEDRPGVLNRITSLFRRRGFNIESLSVGRARAAGVSRMTIVVLCDGNTSRRLVEQLSRLVNVLRCDELTDTPSIRHELAMFKVAARPEERTQVIQLATATGARIVDVALESVVIEATASPGRIDGLAEVLRPYGILEQVRTGLVTMARSTASVMTEPAPRQLPRRVASAAEPDDGSGSV